MAWSDKVIEPFGLPYEAPPTMMWEILVPTEKRIKTPMPRPEDGWGDDVVGALEYWQRRNAYTTRYHRVWDEKVRAITGGLTILTPAKGQWISPDGELFVERMIPVRIVATRAQIEQIIEMTMGYYDQLAVLCFKIGDEVILRNRK